MKDEGTKIYIDISNQIVAPSFYGLWVDGEDANFDGVVDDDDIEFYGLTKTDEDGNYVYDPNKVLLIQIFMTGTEFEFSLFTISLAENQIISTQPRITQHC
jgi:hypothetical protein